jgi:hypothetical protein
LEATPLVQRVIGFFVSKWYDHQETHVQQHEAVVSIAFLTMLSSQSAVHWACCRCQAAFQTATAIPISHSATKALRTQDNPAPLTPWPRVFFISSSQICLFSAHALRISPCIPDVRITPSLSSPIQLHLPMPLYCRFAADNPPRRCGGPPLLATPLHQRPNHDDSLANDSATRFITHPKQSPQTWPFPPSRSEQPSSTASAFPSDPSGSQP